ncbi:MAG TPA: 2-oxo-4-hydroxy-4-carboxy-5-ureidoimidazoline decarboxylase [Pyrinomonadaceae bacterium]|nr:2-oxo-4-hydroxy-4-carboxy-5-ureidoimidazoline decarboxylase [Pyrinomonadaceae bacterium]
MNTNLETSLHRWNSLPAEEAQNELLKCCGSREWSRLMVAARPFPNVDDLTAKADQIWWSLAPNDWLEAFHSHPKIGEKKAAATTSEQSRRWSEAEQAGVNDAASETLQSLADLNARYEEKFGYIFIVCASGKGPAEMLQILRARLENPADEELRNAATEQARITQLRLKKLIDS